MTDVLSREIAAKIVQEGLLGNWRFYGILLSLLVIGAVINAFLIRYIGKRADIYATSSVPTFFRGEGADLARNPILNLLRVV